MNEMRRDADFFEDREMDLIYIAKNLKEALRLENALTESGVEYAVETDQYSGGLRSQHARRSVSSTSCRRHSSRRARSCTGIGFRFQEWSTSSVIAAQTQRTRLRQLESSS